MRPSISSSVLELVFDEVNEPFAALDCYDFFSDDEPTLVMKRSEIDALLSQCGA